MFGIGIKILWKWESNTLITLAPPILVSLGCALRHSIEPMKARTGALGEIGAPALCLGVERLI